MILGNTRQTTMRALVLCLSLLVAIATIPIPSAPAQELPEIPDSLRILSIQEVKNYWVNMMPEPLEPSRLKRGYDSLIVEYHRQVGERHRLIQEIRAGEYDGYAQIIMLRHNLQAYLLRGDDAQVVALDAELAELEAAARREEAERANQDRLERLIAATERLAAAIENNGGQVPAGADEIIPFERDQDDERSLLTYLYDEIAICRQPLVVPYQHGHGSPDRAHVEDGHRQDHPANPYPEEDPRGHDGRGNRQPRQFQELSPQVVSPSQPGPGSIPPRSQPQVRPVPSPVPSQPQVRPVPAPMQPQVRPAR